MHAEKSKNIVVIQFCWDKIDYNIDDLKFSSQEELFLYFSLYIFLNKANTIEIKHRF